MDSKKPWLSKTLWVNAVVAVAALAGQDWLVGWLKANDMVVLAIVAGVNILLRLVTKDKIQIQEDPGKI